jgi:hypothetical protein
MAGHYALQVVQLSLATDNITHVYIHDSIEIIPPPSQSVGDRVQVNMIYIHNVYIRALNSIYSKATVVKPEDVNAFVGYCLTAHQAVYIHHHHEGLSSFILHALNLLLIICLFVETIMFPFLSKKLDMSDNVEQHEAFQDGFVAFGGYLNQVRAGKEKFDGEKLKALLVAFADPLVQHLHDEVIQYY